MLDLYKGTRDDNIWFNAICEDKSLRKFQLFSSEKNIIEIGQVEKHQMAGTPIKLMYSPDQKHILISFYDNSLSLFHSQNKSNKLKEYISLYGHSLPITDFDVSSDSYIVATVSNDKSLRIWDRDFGNCRKIIGRAHEGGINQL